MKARRAAGADTPDRVVTASGAARTLGKYEERAEPERLMRPLLVAGFVLAVIVAGTLGIAAFSQGDAQQRRDADRQQQYVGTVTAGAAGSNSTVVNTPPQNATVEAQASSTARLAALVGTRQAEATAGSARLAAEATQSASTLAALRTSADATLTAVQVRDRATNTALARP